MRIEKSMESKQLGQVENYVVKCLSVLAANVLGDVKKELRQKYEQIITDYVH